MNATVIAHWPRKDVPACDVDLAKLMGVAATLGFRLSATTAPEGMLCSNCENEAKRAASKNMEAR